MQRTRSALFAPVLMATLLGIGVASSSARAEGPGPVRLAPPGECAEPREAVGSDDSASRFSVVGPVSALFNPSNVAAPPSIAAQSPPTASAAAQRAACDVPGAGCRGALAAPNPPIIPGGRPNPAAR